MRYACCALLFLAGCAGSPATPGDKPAAATNKPGAAAPPETRPAAREARTYIRVSPFDLVEAYRGNEAAADAKYKGQGVEVKNSREFRGHLVGNRFSQPESDGGRYVIWYSQWGDETRARRRNVIFVFAPKESARLASLKLDLNTTIRGVCAGKTGTFYVRDDLPRDPVIEVHDCELAESP
jgi:hypothetical protein